MYTGIPISACRAKIRFGSGGAYIFEGMEWHVDEDVSTYDSTSFEDEGYRDEDGCALKADIRIKGLWDLTRNPHQTPLFLNPRQILVKVSLFLDGAQNGGLRWYFPKVIVRRGLTEAEVRSGLTYEVLMGSKSRYYRPGETVAPQHL